MSHTVPTTDDLVDNLIVDPDLIHLNIRLTQRIADLGETITPWILVSHPWFPPTWIPKSRVHDYVNGDGETRLHAAADVVHPTIVWGDSREIMDDIRRELESTNE